MNGPLLALVACLLATAAVASDGLDLAIGKAVFDRMWVQAPSSTKHADGLGPLFAARSCASCHAGSGGRTTFRLGRDDPATHPGIVLRLGDGVGSPDPTYGAELQPEGLAGATGEGRAAVRFAEGAAPRRPDWRVENWAYGAPAPSTKLSPRVAPSLAGLGLLARVPDAAILAREDPDDRDHDGVRGHANRVTTPDGVALGRFGWKATEPTLEAQAASAFSLDIGLSTTLRPDGAGDCTDKETACRAAPVGAAPGEPEVAEPLMRRLVAFVESRPAPAPKTGARMGAAVFARVGCAACHAPALPLAGGGEAAAYTDLLLHDMGPGLDDGMADGAAKSAEWRTAPLWGLSDALAQGSGLLHDGRAATVREALAWHGGEALGAKTRFDALSKKDRNALIAFVNGL